MQTLTAKTKAALVAHILERNLQRGDRLGSLNELCELSSASRTVVREALAALRSDGVVEVRHGVGVFVREPPSGAEDDSATVDVDRVLAPLGRLKSSFMDLLELRMAFEVHAAGLAASRRSWAQEANIWNAARQFEALLDDESKLDDLDFAFHRSIAEATNNGAFIEFFRLVSHKIMPQPAFSKELNPVLITPDYIRNTAIEHHAICEAISAGDPEKAREAMKAHLDRSHRRYRGFADGPAHPLSNLARDE